MVFLKELFVNDFCENILANKIRKITQHAKSCCNDLKHKTKQLKNKIFNFSFSAKNILIDITGNAKLLIYTVYRYIGMTVIFSGFHRIQETLTTDTLYTTITESSKFYYLFAMSDLQGLVKLIYIPLLLYLL